MLTPSFHLPADQGDQVLFSWFRASNEKTHRIVAVVAGDEMKKAEKSAIEKYLCTYYYRYREPEVMVGGEYQKQSGSKSVK